MPTTLDNAIWLAQRQMRDQWPSYILTVLYFAMMGGILASAESFAQEFAHVVLMAILIQPVLASRYMTFKKDNDVVRHQVFLRTVPFSMRSTILARLLAMLVAGLLNVPVYFGIMWYFGDYDLSLGQFIAWTIFWVGIALLGAGTSLLQEFWLNFRKWSVLNLIVMCFIVAILPISIWVLDFRPFRDSMTQAAESPIAFAVAGIVIGFVSIVASVVVATNLYQKREYIL